MAVKLGPGVLKIGEVGSEIDISCDVNNVKVSAEKDTGDDSTKLCGTVLKGSRTYTYVLSGNLDIDPETDAGLFALSQAEPGAEVPYVFTPNTAAGTTATGVLIIDPLDFGGDESGEWMTSDFEFDLTAQPAYTYGVGPAAAMTEDPDEDVVDEVVF